MKKLSLFIMSFILITFIVYSQPDTTFNKGAVSQENAILFKFEQKKGTSTSHIAEVEEAAYFNGRLNNRTQFINRMTTTVEKELENGAAQIQTNYMITQNSLINGYTNTLTWGEESTVDIIRQANGQFYTAETFAELSDLPTIRGVPSFPDYPVKPGESWSMKGEEVHDFRELFNMTEYVRVPFTADYKYIGPYKYNGKIYEQIEVYYEFQQNNYNNRIYNNGIFKGIQGIAAQSILWDTDTNDIFHYEEEFQIELYDHYNNSYYFTGISAGDVTEYKSLNNDDEVEKLKNTMEEYNLKDVSVSKGEKGLTISIENIQFEPDSDLLLNSEQIKLEKIGKILKTVSNDLLITGHCADRGTKKAQQNLSESRAKAVADFLINNGVRDQYHIFTQGKGASEPIASNKTEKGRQKNRRVEITIMD